MCMCVCGEDEIQKKKRFFHEVYMLYGYIRKGVFESDFEVFSVVWLDTLR